MSGPTEYASFIVRFWRKPNAVDASTTEWSGEVKNIQSGLHWRFDTVTEVLDFLRQALTNPDILQPPMDE